MCFVTKNVNRVVLICATHVQLSTIPCSQKLIKYLCFSTTVVGDNVPIYFKFESCEQQTRAKTLKSNSSQTQLKLASNST